MVAGASLILPFFSITPSLFGLSGIVWSQVTADTLTAALSLWVYRRCESRSLAEAA